jgi:DNA-binding transcriptional ArsR family regulator
MGYPYLIPMATADLILHPVRLRIVRAFLGGRSLTTSALAAELADVPAASLYRHVARLVDAGVLEVVAERRVRGTIERTFVLHVAAANIGASDLAVMWLTDAELGELAHELTQVIVPRLANAPGPGRTRRVLRTFLLPAGEPPQEA